jgi:hypothetical protein
MALSRFDRIRNSPALYPGVADALGERFPWHVHVAGARSSQALCLSAWVPLGGLEARHEIVERLLAAAFADRVPRRRPAGAQPPVPPRADRRWHIVPEMMRPELLGERAGRSSAIDVLLEADDAVVCVESKYLGDAAHGFGRCSEFPESCRGYHGPGSDIETDTAIACRLTAGGAGREAPRYWTVADRFFLAEALKEQQAGDTCALNRHYQLARNLFFAAEYARATGREHVAVLAIAPAATAGVVERQVATFGAQVLRPEHARRVATVHYERLVELLLGCGDEEAAAVGRFVAARLPALPASPPRTETVRELRRRVEADRRARRPGIQPDGEKRGI